MVIGNRTESPIAGAGITEQMLWLDLVGYLPDDILVKLDRAAMAVSLETRVPFLDRRILDLAWSLPLDAKLRGGRTKWVLRQVLERHVPAALVERPKMGFGLPIGAWLRGSCAPWAEHLLDERRLRDQGLLDPLPVRRAWDLHRSGRRDLGYGSRGIPIYRLERRGWIKGKWGESENNRRARFYALTAAGTRQRRPRPDQWTDMAAVVAVILDKKADEI